MSCRNSLDFQFLNTHDWQYDKGFKIGEGDFLTFASGTTIFEIRNDTILKKKDPIAIIVKIDNDKKELVVRSIINREEGVYIDTGEFVE